MAVICVAEESLDRRVERAATKRRNATIGDTAIVEVLVRKLQRGLWINDDRRRGIQAVAFEIDTVAEAASVFVKTVEAERETAIDWLVYISGETLHAERAALECEFAQRREASLFADAIDHAATAAAAEQHRVWTFQCLDPLDVVEIAIVLDVVAHTVEKEVGAGVVAANDELVAIVFALVRRDARNVGDDVSNAAHCLIANLFLRDDGD